ncbi:hypothetical protein GGQ54_001363 [Naumannella cuiyingiana]|uniref:Restriction endonuclease n=1 Tax=Naumannella cuiyingiana TaxID=1347891 RepID=A0A7Z0IKS1_9ACTN|nr:restriction endonuclease [Naumannella cuiyingiana]NYI70803.1 hypothetical protein [Naumannella cuiyingiana]
MADHGRAGDERCLGMLDIVRYARESGNVDVFIDGYRNFHQLAKSPGISARIQLERGINTPAEITAPDARRRPVILLRSSPGKAGSATTPWEDVFDLDHGHARYFGDHKASTVGPIGATQGNRALLDAWQLHGSSARADRVLAPPILLMRGVSVMRDGKRVDKGHLEFCGVAVIERLEYIVQRDPQTARTFPNLAVDLAVIKLDETTDELDFRWIDDRRDGELTAEQANAKGPASWRRWVDQGKVAIPRIRRRVLSSRVRSAADQRPESGTPDAALLDTIYRHFDDRKHEFEKLAAAVAASVFAASGATYHDGWLSRAGGDGGLDFVGRLDAGSTAANTPLVVLGQAKCIKPESSVSPDQVARVVARLRRGWIGVFVTTGVFSQQAQIEVIDDGYPVVLVPGRELVAEVRKLAETSAAGDIEALLRDISSDYADAVTHRRPEEILGSA